MASSDTESGILIPALEDSIQGPVTLEYFRKGIYFAAVRVFFQGTACVLCFDEEGLLKKLPPNPRASLLAKMDIVGNVLLVSTDKKKKKLTKELVEEELFNF
jgi:hypothetical protein